MTSICKRCRYVTPRPPGGYKGPCDCLYDPAQPVHVIVRKRTGCPAGYFTAQGEVVAVPPPPDSIPRDQWPLAVRVVARQAREGEKGIGDTLARLIVGGEKFKRLMKRIGVDCGCAAQQAQLNAIYPY